VVRATPIAPTGRGTFFGDSHEIKSKVDSHISDTLAKGARDGKGEKKCKTQNAKRKITVFLRFTFCVLR
jgi:hypothetical protein